MRRTHALRASFEPLPALFPGRRFGGGALAVYLDGQPVVDVWKGGLIGAGWVPWSADSAPMVFSATGHDSHGHPPAGPARVIDYETLPVLAGVRHQRQGDPDGS